MKASRFHLVAAALLFSTPSLTGCGENGVTAPVSHIETVDYQSTGSTNLDEKLFQEIEAQALAALSVSEAVLITPFINGSKTPETAR